MQMTPTEKKLFREAVIREYQLKHERKKRKKMLSHQLLESLKKIAPFNLVIGVIASIIYVTFRGWANFFVLFLQATIWITLISTVISTILSIKKA